MSSPQRRRATPGAPGLGPTAPTIIVGGGIAGLACARRLHDAQRPFLVVTEIVGGRIRRSRDGAINLGAYYVRADYTNVNRYVQRGRRLDHLAIRRHDEAGDTYTFRNRRLLLHLPQAARFLRQLERFRRSYAQLKRRTVMMGQAAAIRADPLLMGLYQQPASDFFAEHEIPELGRWYLAPGMHGTTFTTSAEITAFTLLLGALPILIPAYEFRPQFDRLVHGFAHAIVADTVTRVGAADAGFQVETAANGTLGAEQVVIATPTDVAQRLLGLSRTKQPVAAHMFHVAGTLLPSHRRGDIHLFPDTDPTLAIARQVGGTFLVASRRRHPELGRHFADWSVLEHHHWNPAFHVLGRQLLDCEQRPHLYLVGDHNIVGLEDAYLTGLHAANQIIAKTAWEGGKLRGKRLAVRRSQVSAGRYAVM